MAVSQHTRHGFVYGYYFSVGNAVSIQINFFFEPKWAACTSRALTNNVTSMSWYCYLLRILQHHASIFWFSSGRDRLRLLVSLFSFKYWWFRTICQNLFLSLIWFFVISIWLSFYFPWGLQIHHILRRKRIAANRSRWRVFKNKSKDWWLVRCGEFCYISIARNKFKTEISRLFH